MQNGRTAYLIAAVILLAAQLESSPAVAAVTFLGDWSDLGSRFQFDGPQTRYLDGIRVEWVAGYGANHWRMIQERAEDRMQVEHDPTSPKAGAVLRVEVRPGDTVGWTGERAEVSNMLSPTGAQYPVTAESGHEVYGLAVKLDPNWQSPTPDPRSRWRWGLVMQLHAPDRSGGPPAIALAAEEDFHLNVCAGDLEEGGHRKDARSLAFSRGDLQRGHWVQFLIEVTWAYDNTGSLTVYRRDEGESVFTEVLRQVGIPTLQFNSKFPGSDSISPLADGTPFLHYWKVGYYRSPSAGVFNRLWLGPFVRGTSLQEVAVAAFGRP